MTVRAVDAGVLRVGYDRYGDPAGPSVVLLHGFPYDVRAYDDVAETLAIAGAHVVVPYLRGYGPTRFLDDATMRSGQQAALAHDLHELIGALDLRTPVVAGYDWGGRAACLTSLLWPDSVAGLVTVGGYNVQDIAHSRQPAPVADERRAWYQYYLHSERGRAGLATNRRDYARTLWREWSPTWAFSDATFDGTAGSFGNPDFVDVVVHSYRHRFGLVPGDPAYQASEDVIAKLPDIEVPTIVLDAADDTMSAPKPWHRHAEQFRALRDHRVVAGGHNLPQENPAAFADAVLALLERT